MWSGDKELLFYELTRVLINRFLTVGWTRVVGEVIVLDYPLQKAFAMMISPSLFAKESPFAVAAASSFLSITEQ